MRIGRCGSPAALWARYNTTLSMVLGLTLALISGCSSATSPTPSAAIRPTARSSPISSAAAPSATKRTIEPAITARPSATDFRPPASRETSPPSPAKKTRPLPTPTPDVAARWEAATTIIAGTGRGSSGPAVLLGDGQVLVVGSDQTAELRDAAAGAWHPTEPLNAARSEFALVRLADGRALLAGGVTVPTNGSCSAASYSSAYVFDPAREHWSKTGLLRTARTAPAAAVLQDGRVLVAGGYFHSPDPNFCTSSAIDLVAYRPNTEQSRRDGRWNDMDPGTWGNALATAELFDPVLGTWSSTGHLAYARYGAAAATLTDGRVLVVGAGIGFLGGGFIRGPVQAYTTAEIYDPRSGRFVLTGPFPPLDVAALTVQGVPAVDVTDDPYRTNAGTLVALDDGGALLIGTTLDWKHGATVTRSFRYDATTSTWAEIEVPYVWTFNPAGDGMISTDTPNREGAFVARLPDGRVLVAGGADSARAELYDPRNGAWLRLPLMPRSRWGGSAVTLPDGSVLLVGGETSWDGSVTAVRFVLEP